MNFNCPLILASSSPRRKFLLEGIGLNFTVTSPNIDETFPGGMTPESVPAWLAKKKADVIAIDKEVVIASDTVVILDGVILNKPINRHNGIDMLASLSGKTHKVVTAVCIRSLTKTIVFDDVTLVTFRTLTRQDIVFYVDHFTPLDKAGSYGAQDCLPAGMNPCSQMEIDFLKSIGKTSLIGQSIRRLPDQDRVVIVDRIEGSYFTVMGLPIHLLYDKLARFAD